MKDLLIKLTIIAIIAAVLCAGLVFLDNTIANAQEEDYKCTYDYCVNARGCYWAEDRVACELGCIDVCKVVPYPAPTPYPAPVPFAFPLWLQVILDSIAAWL